MANSNFSSTNQMNQLSLNGISRSSLMTNQSMLSTLNIASLGTQSVIPWQTTPEAYVKKYEVIETSEDVLVLSCAWQRLRDQVDTKSPHIKIGTLLQKELFGLVEVEDREKANLIRDFYSKKIVLWKLKEKRLSTFRDDLNVFVHDTSNKISEKMLPLAYRLPEFYDYDIAFEEMVRKLDKRTRHKVISDSGMIDLVPLRKFSVGKKGLKRIEYWMKDREDQMYCMNIQPSNPLISIWDKIYDSSDSLNFKVDSYQQRARDDVNYVELTKWQLS